MENKFLDNQVQESVNCLAKNPQGQIRMDLFEVGEDHKLYYDGELVAEFFVTVIEVKVNPDDDADRTYLLEVIYDDRRTSKKRWVKDLKRIDYFKEFQVNDTFLSGDSRQLLQYKLLYDAGQLQPQIDWSGASGLYGSVKKGLTYVLGGEVISEWTKLGIPTRRDSSCDKEELLKYVTLIPKVTIILFFFAMYSVVRPFVERVCNRGGCVLSLIAPSGHLKTTLARLYCLSSNQTDNEISFISAVRTTDFLGKVLRKSGQIVLYDDLHRVNSTEGNKKQESRLDSLVRYVCDSGRDTANAIITGESIEDMGRYSALDRLFTVLIPQMNGAQIEEIKAKVLELELGTLEKVRRDFVKVLMENPERIFRDIESFLKESRQTHKPTGNAVRTHGYALYIKLAARLFQKYYLSLDMESVLEEALVEQTRTYEKMLQRQYESQKSRDYVVEFYETICNTNEYIHICSSYEEFERYGSDKAYFVKEDKLFITSAGVENAFYERYKCHVTARKIMCDLHQKRILIEEESSRGFQKKYINKKFYVVHFPTLVSRLDDSGYDVPDKVKAKWLC